MRRSFTTRLSNAKRQGSLQGRSSRKISPKANMNPGGPSGRRVVSPRAKAMLKSKVGKSMPSRPSRPRRGGPRTIQPFVGGVQPPRSGGVRGKPTRPVRGGRPRSGGVRGNPRPPRRQPRPRYNR